MTWTLAPGPPGIATSRAIRGAYQFTWAPACTWVPAAARAPAAGPGRPAGTATAPNRVITTCWPCAIARSTMAAPGGRRGGTLVRRPRSTPRTDTLQKPVPGWVAATTRPLIPATTMVTGSSAAAITGLQSATNRASTTIARVQGRTPNSATPIAATGTRKMPRRR